MSDVSLMDRLLAVTADGTMYKSYDDLIRDVESPSWGDERGPHNWKAHIFDGLRTLWPELPLEAKLVAFMFAEDSADNEEWE
jgi:hypothetical protein